MVDIDSILFVIGPLLHFELACKGMQVRHVIMILLTTGSFSGLVSKLELQICYQLLLVQDGKLYGRIPIFAVITRAAGLPEVAKDHDIQKNEFMVQLGQVVKL